MPSKVDRQMWLSAIPGPLQPFAVRLAEQFAFTADDIDLVMGATGADTATSPPTAIPTSTTKYIDPNEDGSMDVILTWSYTQGTLPAENFILFWKQGAAPLAPITVSDNAVMVGADARAFRFEGLNPLNNYRFGIAAGRRPTATSGMIVGAIVQPASGAGSWADLTFGDPNFVGLIQGVEQHNWDIGAAGFYVSAARTGVLGLTRDGVAVTWPFADSEYTLGLSSGQHGLAYNLTVFDLVAEQCVYAHCYDTFNYGVAAGAADTMAPVVTGTGSAGGGQTGPYGWAVMTNAVDSGSNRAYIRTGAAAPAYSNLQVCSVWFKKTGAPLVQSTVVGLNETATADAGYRVPLLAVNSNGTVSSYLWTGAAFVTVTGTVNVCDGNWHQLKTRISGGFLRLHIDGNADGTAATSNTVYTPSPPAGGFYLHLGAGNGGSSSHLLGQAFYDELLVSQTFGVIPNNSQSAEWSDLLTGTDVTAMWHFQDSSGVAAWVNARCAPAALAQVIAAYNGLVANTGDSARYLLAVHAQDEPQINRRVGGLPAALATIGANRAVFESDQFRRAAAYALVGAPLLGEGNGVELYAGTTDNDVNAVLHGTFQTQGSRLVSLSGTGWQQNNRPGPPTNAPTGTAFSNVAVPETASRTHTLTWDYTQPALFGDNLLADGFILNYQKADTTTPNENAVKVDVSVRKYTFQWAHEPGAKVSYTVCAYRKSSSGIEVGPTTQYGAWKGASADLYIQSFAPGPPTNAPAGGGFTSTTMSGGGRVHELTWTYSQGALPADGFVMDYENADTTSPTAQQAWIDAGATKAQFYWSYNTGGVVSYRLRAFRRSQAGVEYSSAYQFANWKGATASSAITNTGIGTGQVQGGAGGGVINISPGTVTGGNGVGDLAGLTVDNANVRANLSATKITTDQLTVNGTLTIFATTVAFPVVFNYGTFSGMRWDEGGTARFEVSVGTVLGTKVWQVLPYSSAHNLRIGSSGNPAQDIEVWNNRWFCVGQSPPVNIGGQRVIYVNNGSAPAVGASATGAAIWAAGGVLYGMGASGVATALAT